MAGEYVSRCIIATVSLRKNRGASCAFLNSESPVVGLVFDDCLDRLITEKVAVFIGKFQRRFCLPGMDYRWTIGGIVHQLVNP